MQAVIDYGVCSCLCVFFGVQREQKIRKRAKSWIELTLELMMPWVSNNYFFGKASYKWDNANVRMRTTLMHSVGLLAKSVQKLFSNPPKVRIALNQHAYSSWWRQSHCCQRTGVLEKIQKGLNWPMTGQTRRSKSLWMLRYMRRQLNRINKHQSKMVSGCAWSPGIYWALRLLANP